MTWPEICSKYKDTELMKEFWNWVANKFDVNVIYRERKIQDIWGYLVCFAETKGYEITNDNFSGTISQLQRYNPQSDDKAYRIIEFEDDFDNIEQAMLWCADKFFEVA